jgi:hypothetical protein
VTSAVTKAEEIEKERSDNKIDSTVRLEVWKTSGYTIPNSYIWIRTSHDPVFILDCQSARIGLSEFPGCRHLNSISATGSSVWKGKTGAAIGAANGNTLKVRTELEKTLRKRFVEILGEEGREHMGAVSGGLACGTRVRFLRARWEDLGDEGDMGVFKCWYPGWVDLRDGNPSAGLRVSERVLGRVRDGGAAGKGKGRIG